MATTHYGPTPYRKLKRQQLLTVAYALEDMRDRAIKRSEDAEAALDRVRELHRPFRIYDECGHQHALNDDGNPPDGVVEIEEVGLTCADGLMYSICWTCCTDGYLGYQREDCLNHAHGRGIPICDTAALLDDQAVVACERSH